jgi:hypothetical protein
VQHAAVDDRDVANLALLDAEELARLAVSGEQASGEAPRLVDPE